MGAGVAVNTRRELVVLPGDDIGREVIPLAVRCLRAVAPDVALVEGEAGYEEHWRTGSPVSESNLVTAFYTGAVLMGPERPPRPNTPSALDALTSTLNLFAALYPLPQTVVLTEHVSSYAPPRSGPLSADEYFSATRLGNFASTVAQRHDLKVALAHDSEEEFARAVMGGLEPTVAVERVNALYLFNDFAALTEEFGVILLSARTAHRLMPKLLQGQRATSTGRLLLGAQGVVAQPTHGPLTEQVGWGFANPLGAMRAVVALLRFGWDDLPAARRLEQAILRATNRRRTPALGGIHTMYEVTRAVLAALEQ